MSRFMKTTKSSALKKLDCIVINLDQQPPKLNKSDSQALLLRLTSPVKVKIAQQAKPSEPPKRFLSASETTHLIQKLSAPKELLAGQNYSFSPYIGQTSKILAQMKRSKSKQIKDVAIVQSVVKEQWKSHNGSRVLQQKIRKKLQSLNLPQQLTCSDYHQILNTIQIDSQLLKVKAIQQFQQVQRQGFADRNQIFNVVLAMLGFRPASNPTLKSLSKLHSLNRLSKSQPKSQKPIEQAKCQFLSAHSKKLAQKKRQQMILKFLEEQGSYPLLADLLSYKTSSKQAAIQEDSQDERQACKTTITYPVNLQNRLKDRKKYQGVQQNHPFSPDCKSSQKSLVLSKGFNKLDKAGLKHSQRIKKAQKQAEIIKISKARGVSYKRAIQIFSKLNPDSQPSKELKRQSTPLLYVDVTLQNGHQQRIIVHEQDTAQALSEQFAKKQGLDVQRQAKLQKYLRQYMQSLLPKIFQEQD